jgi:hypothetical protein
MTGRARLATIADTRQIYRGFFSLAALVSSTSGTFTGFEDLLKEHGVSKKEVERQLGWRKSRLSDLKGKPSALR